MTTTGSGYIELLTSSGTAATAGALSLTAGTSTGATGSDVTIHGGNAATTGGNVILTPGTGSGSNGNIQLAGLVSLSAFQAITATITSAAAAVPSTGPVLRITAADASQKSFIAVPDGVSIGQLLTMVVTSTPGTTTPGVSVDVALTLNGFATGHICLNYAAPSTSGAGSATVVWYTGGWLVLSSTNAHVGFAC